MSYEKIRKCVHCGYEFKPNKYLSGLICPSCGSVDLVNIYWNWEYKGTD